jgi:hypothetical protein
MNQIVKAAAKSLAKNSEQDIAKQIEETAMIFDISGDELRHLKRAYMFSTISSGLIPDVFKGDYRSIFIMSMKAERMGIPLAEVLQGGYFVHGRWGWYAEFMISRVLEKGIFTAIDYELGGKFEDFTACAIAIGTRPDGTKAIGSKVTLKMAKDQGWIDKTGSKWKDMPGIMLKKRAATFLIKETAAHAFGGSLDTEEDIQDVTPKAAVNKPASDTLKYISSKSADTQVEESAIEAEQEIVEVLDDDPIDELERQRMDVFNAVEKMIAARKALGAVDAEIENTIGFALHEVEAQDMKTLMKIAKDLK